MSIKSLMCCDYLILYLVYALSIQTRLLGLLVEILENAGHSVALLAPTGRAADRLSKATNNNVNASTIHRKIQLDYKTNSHAPATAGVGLTEDFCIIDESSMLDTLVASELLGAIPVSTHVLFVGDKNQLESVSAGSVLRDLMECRDIPVSRLSHSFRQGNAGSVAEFSAQVLQKQSQLPKEIDDSSDLQTGEDCNFLAAVDSEACAELTVQVIKKIFSLFPDLDPHQSIQVLCPKKQGKAGLNALNTLLQVELNDSETNKSYHGYKTGDKVMQIVNKYDAAVYEYTTILDEIGDDTQPGSVSIFNGNVGKVVDVNKDRVLVEFDGNTIQYDALTEAQNDLQLAYAVTIHKSQGSEYDVVILVIPEDSYFVDQRMMYTAVTRGKKVVIVGDPDAILRAMNRLPTSRRTLQQDYFQRQKDGWQKLNVDCF